MAARPFGRRVRYKKAGQTGFRVGAECLRVVLRAALCEQRGCGDTSYAATHNRHTDGAKLLGQLRTLNTLPEHSSSACRAICPLK